MLGDHRVHQILLFFVFSVLTGRRATTNAASHGSGGHSDNSGSSNSWIRTNQDEYYNRFLDAHHFYGVDTFRPAPSTNANRNVRPTPTTGNRTVRQPAYNPPEASNRIALRTPPLSAANSPESRFNPTNTPQFPSPPAVGSQHQGVFPQGYGQYSGMGQVSV